MVTPKDAERIVEEVLKESASVLGRQVASDSQGASDVRRALEDLVQTKYMRDRDNFIDLEVSEFDDAAQASGSGKFMSFFLARLRGYLCGDKEAAAKIQDAVKRAKSQPVATNINVPTSAGLSAGGAAIVYVAVASALAGTALAALAPPLVAGVALIIFLSGFDSFCEWSKPEGDDESSAAKTKRKASGSRGKKSR